MLFILQSTSALSQRELDFQPSTSVTWNSKARQFSGTITLGWGLKRHRLLQSKPSADKFMSLCFLVVLLQRCNWHSVLWKTDAGQWLLSMHTCGSWPQSMEGAWHLLTSYAHPGFGSIQASTHREGFCCILYCNWFLCNSRSAKYFHTVINSKWKAWNAQICTDLKL